MDTHVLKQLIVSQEDTMPRMNDTQVIEFIRKKRDEENLSFQKIADLLNKMGHTSRRTDGPLTLNAVRHKYYYGSVENPRPQFAPNTPEGQVHSVEDRKGEAEHLKSMIRAFIKLPVEDKIKVKLIKDLVDGDVDSL